MLGRRGPADGGNACALKIISGTQDGLTQRWRLNRVNISPLGACFIAQLQTPTATLALAMPGGQLELAVQDLTRSG